MLTTMTAGAVATLGTALRSSPLLRFVVGTAHGFGPWAERRRQLRALAELDEHLLRDVGLSREDVERACSKSFWMC
jgi:uncharacterized protein YjiS (DUF1127 family)